MIGESFSKGLTFVLLEGYNATFQPEGLFWTIPKWWLGTIRLKLYLTNIYFGKYRKYLLIEC